MRGSFRVDQQATPDASKSGVPVVNGAIPLVVAGLFNQARRPCFPFYPNPGREGAESDSYFFTPELRRSEESNGTLPFGGLVI